MLLRNNKSCSTKPKGPTPIISKHIFKQDLEPVLFTIVSTYIFMLTSHTVFNLYEQKLNSLAKFRMRRSLQCHGKYNAFIAVKSFKKFWGWIRPPCYTLILCVSRR
jgi:hypothetical protein